jgi:hypothetical protein
MNFLTVSIYFYDIQAIISLSKISEYEEKSITNVSNNLFTMASQVKQ